MSPTTSRRDPAVASLLRRDTGTEILVELERGGEVETRHRGAVVVVDCKGTAVSVGDAELPVYIRSSVKPFVAALLVQSGAVDAFGLTDDELAIVGGSHMGTDNDTAAVAGILGKIGLSEAALRNPAGGPDDEATKTRLAAARETPGPIRQMCSGEHAGILALCVHRRWPVDGYWREDHPAQREIEALVALLFSPDVRPHRAIDDCGLPTWRIPLQSVARGFAWLARPERLPDELRDLEEPLRRVRDAMLASPERISGPGQLDTDLTATDDAFVAKEGAEGLLGIGCVGTGLGIALSIEDGDVSRRATKVVALETLCRLRLLDDESFGRLREAHWKPVTDPHDREVAVARAVFELPAAE